MSTIDNRYQGRREPVVRIEVPTINCPNGATAEVTTTVPFNMTLKTIVVRAGACAGANPTFTLKLSDDNGAVHLTKATIVKDAKTVLLSTKTTHDFDEICMNGIITVGITPSLDPATVGGVNVNVDLYGV